MAEKPAFCHPKTVQNPSVHGHCAPQDTAGCSGCPMAHPNPPQSANDRPRGRKAWPETRVKRNCKFQLAKTAYSTVLDGRSALVELLASLEGLARNSKHGLYAYFTGCNFRLYKHVKTDLTTKQLPVSQLLFKPCLPNVAWSLPQGSWLLPGRSLQLRYCWAIGLAATRELFSALVHSCKRLPQGSHEGERYIE